MSDVRRVSIADGGWYAESVNGTHALVPWETWEEYQTIYEDQKQLESICRDVMDQFKEADELIREVAWCDGKLQGWTWKRIRALVDEGVTP